MCWCVDVLGCGGVVLLWSWFAVVLLFSCVVVVLCGCLCEWLCGCVLVVCLRGCWCDVGVAAMLCCCAVS